jgi:hypothetical protein
MNLEEKKSKSVVLVVVALVFTLVLMGYVLFFSGEGETGNSNQIGQMKEMTRQVRDLESGVKAKQNEISTLVQEYRKKTGETQPLGFNPMDLDQETQALVKQRIKAEKDVSVKALLREVLEKNSDIRELKEKIAKIEDRLPAPHTVKKGENHYQVAMDFLVEEKGVDKEQAVELLERTALFDELVEGFKVWNFYDGQEYGTAVTQGDAEISPNMLIHLAKKKLSDARDQAVAQRDKLAEDFKSLEENRDQAVTQLDALNKEKEGLVNRVDALDQRVNSLYYLLDSQQNLKKLGILKTSFLRSPKLNDPSPEQFIQSLDLRSKDQLVISAADLGIRRINDVNLYPKTYKAGTVYKVEMTADKRYAVLTLLEKDRFKNERLVIAVN